MHLLRHYAGFRGTWKRIRRFCLFVGYGRSGHSAIGSVLDAHPNAAVSHELNALRLYLAGVHRNQLFAEILWTSWRQARQGRRSSRVDGPDYLHRIEGQDERRMGELLVLGDKKGGGTTLELKRHGIETLDGFQSFVGVPVRLIHVIRNPFDIVAAGIVKGRFGFPAHVATLARVRERYLGPNWLDVYYEDVLANPRQEVERLCRFLGLPVVERHVAAACSYLLPEPHRRRFDVAWPDGWKDTVAQLIRQHEFLSRYSWSG